MSTNKTTNYQLHQWEAEDTFLREEFNENFVTLDTAVGEKVVFGSYTGNGGGSRTIELGFMPKAVYLDRGDGSNTSGSVVNSGLFGPGLALNRFASVTSTGFTMSNLTDTYSKLNESGAAYYYIAFR